MSQPERHCSRVCADDLNSTVKRGIRFLNGRQQVLIQDDIAGVPAGMDVQWRANTNATVTVSSNGTTASLALGGQTLIASILAGPAGAVFTTSDANRTTNDPAVPTGPNTAEDGDQPNPGVTVLIVDSTAGGNFSLQVLLNPQWSEQLCDSGECGNRQLELDFS